MFRQYAGQYGGSVPLKSTARKCTLPVRVPDPSTKMLPEDVTPQEVSAEKTEEFALRAFFHDYCVISTNPSFSLGYLSGLESMINDLGWQSDVAKACRIVAFANHGIKLCRPCLTRKAETYYQDLLASLAEAMNNPATASATRSLIIAMLLGLYEMIVADEAYPGNHQAHARGVAAILAIRNSPFDLFGAVQANRLGYLIASDNGTPQKFDMFPAPKPKAFCQTLAGLLLKFGPLWKKADALLSNPLADTDDLYQLEKEAASLDQAFSQWQDSQAEDFKPCVIGYVNQRQAGSKFETGHWPGKVDTYYDLYVAAVWNIARSVRVLLIDLDHKLSNILGRNYGQNTEHPEVLLLVEDIISSVPFHLAEDLPTFMGELDKNCSTIKPGRPVGGLLLMHPLYVASKVCLVPQQMQEYTRCCLEWIASVIGIGQASLYAKDILLKDA
ncbi:MAG: hypothetical protein Q9167_002937 [Letrouitia subvulpina]